MMQGSLLLEFREEHGALLRDLADLQSGVRGLAEPERGTGAPGASLMRDELEVLQRRLRIHFRREEEALFPEAQRMISESARGADVFGRFFAGEAEEDMGAHEALSLRINEMLEIVSGMASSGAPEEAGARRLLAIANLTLELLQRHAAKEDTLIFPMIENSLTPEQRDEIRARLQAMGSDRDLTSDAEGGLTPLDG